MASSKDKDDTKTTNSATNSLQKSPRKSVTFLDLNDSTAAKLAGLMQKNNNRNSSGPINNEAHHHHHPHYHNSNNSSSDSQSTDSDDSSPSSVDNDNLSDEMENCNLDSIPSGSCTKEIKFHINKLPEPVIETIFSYLNLRDLLSVSLVCSNWATIINSGNNEIWRSHCLSKLHQDALKSATLFNGLFSFKSKLRAFYHAWNPNDCSRNIFVKPNGFTIHRNPVAQSTDGVRGRVGFTSGRHAWEIIWEGPLGTVAVVGIATRRAEMRAQGYVPLLGQDDQSWGWNLVENVLLHNGESQGQYPVINNAPRYQVGERIRVILDCDDCTLSFEKDNEFYGVAFRGLPVSTDALYPAISAVYGNTEVSMVYIGPPVDG